MHRSAPPDRLKWSTLSEGAGGPNAVIKFTNCRLFSTATGRLVSDDLWVRNGCVINPEFRFWEAASFSEFACDLIVDCENLILSPGFVDVQFNGAFGVDFSNPALTTDDVEAVCRKLLPTGVTSFCPTLVSSSPGTYAACTALFSKLKYAHAARHADTVATATAERTPRTPTPSGSTPGNGTTARRGSRTLTTAGVGVPRCTASSIGCIGARVLGLHLEGPFIAVERKGAHAEANLREPVNGMASLRDTYGPQDWLSGDTRIITLAPELARAVEEVIPSLSQRGVVVSIGHTSATIRIADDAVEAGARLVTHLFNAMSAFHHRDPGVVGLLGRMHGGARGRMARHGSSSSLSSTDGSVAPSQRHSAASPVSSSRGHQSSSSEVLHSTILAHLSSSNKGDVNHTPPMGGQLQLSTPPRPNATNGTQLQPVTRSTGTGASPWSSVPVVGGDSYVSGGGGFTRSVVTPRRRGSLDADDEDTCDSGGDCTAGGALLPPAAIERDAARKSSTAASEGDAVPLLTLDPLMPPSQLQLESAMEGVRLSLAALTLPPTSAAAGSARPDSNGHGVTPAAVSASARPGNDSSGSGTGGVSSSRMATDAAFSHTVDSCRSVVSSPGVVASHGGSGGISDLLPSSSGSSSSSNTFVGMPPPPKFPVVPRFSMRSISHNAGGGAVGSPSPIAPNNSGSSGGGGFPLYGPSPLSHPRVVRSSGIVATAPIVASTTTLSGSTAGANSTASSSSSDNGTPTLSDAATLANNRNQLLMQRQQQQQHQHSGSLGRGISGTIGSSPDAFPTSTSFSGIFGSSPETFPTSTSSTFTATPTAEVVSSYLSDTATSAHQPLPSVDSECVQNTPVCDANGGDGTPAISAITSRDPRQLQLVGAGTGGETTASQASKAVMENTTRPPIAPVIAAAAAAAVTIVTPWSPVPYPLPYVYYSNNRRGGQSSTMNGTGKRPSAAAAVVGPSGVPPNPATAINSNSSTPHIMYSTMISPRRLSAVGALSLSALSSPLLHAACSGNSNNSKSGGSVNPHESTTNGDSSSSGAPAVSASIDSVSNSSSSDDGGVLPILTRAMGDEPMPSLSLTQSSSVLSAGVEPQQHDGNGISSGVAASSLTPKGCITTSGTTNTAAAPSSSSGNRPPVLPSPGRVVSSLSPKVDIPGADAHGRPYYSLIADGVHVHPYAVAVAYETHPEGMILVTDAMCAMGLPPGRHKLGELEVDIFHGLSDGHYEGLHAVLAGTSTLAGAVVALDKCARNLRDFTECSVVEVLAAVTTHPARLLRLDGYVGSTSAGGWADLVLLDDSLHVAATFIAGTLAWSSATSK